MDPRGFPTTLPEFQKVFPNDNACEKYLERMRWPEGFTCPKCAQKDEPYRSKTISAVILRCRRCHANISLTADTVMQGTRTPLSTWFWGAYLATTQTLGQSALQFQRQLGLYRYETAFQILHKLRAGMVRPSRDKIGGEHPVEVDECFFGGRTRGEGFGIHHKSIVLGAVEVRQRKDAEERKANAENQNKSIPAKKLVYAGRLRLRLVSDRSGENIHKFLSENVSTGSTVRTDGLRAYKSIISMGYTHAPVEIFSDFEKANSHLPMIHLVFSNLKTWIMGTHHGAIARHHLQAYLNEYTFRFNRRFYPMTAFNSVLGLAAHSTAPTYDQLYSGTWEHPAGPCL